MTPARCHWVTQDPLYLDYHDTEWGVPLHDDRRLFEMLCLEGAQAGLNWLTVLRKRPAYRAAFHDFNPDIVAGFDHHEVERLMQNPGIIRNRRKIESCITNARALLNLRREVAGFDTYLWQFVGGTPRQNAWRRPGDVPSTSREAGDLSRDLKKRGFSFVGPVVCYAFMQAVGMVNDHLVCCFRHGQLTPPDRCR